MAQICGLPLSVHVRGIVRGVLDNGMGGGCEDTYRALLDVAESIKREFGYSDYQPTGDMCGEYLGKAERFFQEGERGEVRIYLQKPLSEPELITLSQTIKAKGGVLTGEIQQVGGIIIMPFRKELPFLLLLVPLLIGVGVVGWQVLKPETIGGTLLIGAVIALLALVILNMAEDTRSSYGTKR